MDDHGIPPPPGGCPPGTHYIVRENPNAPGTWYGSCEPDIGWEPAPVPGSGGPRRRTYTDADITRIVTEKIRAELATQLVEVPTNQPLDPSPVLADATVAGIRDTTAAIAEATTAWRLRVFRANPRLSPTDPNSGQQVRKPVEDVYVEELNAALAAIGMPQMFAPVTRHGSTDPVFLRARIAEWADKPGANASLKNDPEYWVRVIIAAGGWDEGYWGEKFLKPEGS